MGKVKYKVISVFSIIHFMTWKNHQTAGAILLKLLLQD